MPNRIYQFKIALKGITPTVWRRIQVPEGYSFWDFHVAIQDAMSWLDCHLHAFRIRRKHSRAATEIGIPHDYGVVGDPEIQAGWEIPISDYFHDVGATAEYEYDFGDGWQHEIVLEAFSSGKRAKSTPGALMAHKPARPKIVVGSMVTTGCWKCSLIRPMTNTRRCLHGWAESTSHRNLHLVKLNLITRRSVGNWLFQKVGDFLVYTATRSL